MVRKYVFMDESGNFDFSEGAGASRYFILTSVTLEACDIGEGLLALRRDLVWEGIQQSTDDFHATEERQVVRDRVFAELGRWDFRVEATILDKRKARPELRNNSVRFYKTAAMWHFRDLIPTVTATGDELMVFAASLGTKKKRAWFQEAVEDVVQQYARGRAFRTCAWSAASDPCLWVADYCGWAIQRRWERNDRRSWSLIQSKIAAERQAFDDSGYQD